MDSGMPHNFHCTKDSTNLSKKNLVMILRNKKKIDPDVI